MKPCITNMKLQLAIVQQVQRQIENAELTSRRVAFRVLAPSLEKCECKQIDGEKEQEKEKEKTN